MIHIALNCRGQYDIFLNKDTELRVKFIVDTEDMKFKLALLNQIKEIEFKIQNINFVLKLSKSGVSQWLKLISLRNTYSVSWINLIRRKRLCRKI